MGRTLAGERGRIGTTHGTGDPQRAAPHMWRDHGASRLRCVIAGGGLAGLCAALRIAEQGHQVAVFEAGAVCGGRAASWVDPDGRYADTGLHVVGGHYARLLALLVQLHSQDALTWWTRHPWFGADGRRLSFGFSRLPPPLHLLHPLRAMPIGWRELAHLFRVAVHVSRMSPADIDALDDVSLTQWLATHRLTGDFVQALGEFAADATTFLDPSRVSARATVSWLRHFFASRRTARIATWRRPIGAALVDPLARRIRELGGSVRCNAAVAGVREVDGGVTGVLVGETGLGQPYVSSAGIVETVGTHEEIACDALVVAVPVQCLTPVLGARLLAQSGLESAARLSTTPALSALLEFDRSVSPDAAPALASGRAIRDVAVLPRDWPGVDGRVVVQVLLSDARERFAQDDDRLLRTAVSDLAALWPGARGAVVRSSQLQRVEAAMFAAVPGAHALRPEARTGVRNLFVAGDWTRQPYNASMEGAVCSGVAAAEAVGELAHRAGRVS